MNQGGPMFKIFLLILCMSFLAACGSGDKSRSVSSTNEFSDDFDDEFSEDGEEETEEGESVSVGLNLDEEIEYTVEKNDTLNDDFI